MFSDRVNNMLRTPLAGTLLVSAILVLGATGVEQGPPPAEVVVASSGPPQEMPKPGPEHAWLAKRAGQWEIKSKMRFGPDAPWMNSTATEECTVACSGFWLVCTFKGSVMGIPFEGRQQIGYDQYKKKFVSTWIDGMGSYLSVLYGTRSDDGNVLTLTGTMYDPQQEKDINTKIVVSITSDDESVMQMFMPGPEGKEFMTMQLDYKRKK